MMLVLTANKRKMMRLVKEMGYDPPRNAQFTKAFRDRTWWLEWNDKIGSYSATLSAAAGKAFFGMRFSDGENPEKWTAKTFSVEDLRKYGLVEQESRETVAAPNRERNMEKELRGGLAMAQLFTCKTIEQKKIEQWLSDQGITAGDIADVRLSGPAMVRVTNPAGQYMDIYCDNAYHVRVLDVTQEQEEALDRLWDSDPEDPEAADWRQDLTADEAAMVEQWDKQYAGGYTSLTQQIEAIEKRAPKVPTVTPHRELVFER